MKATVAFLFLGREMDIQARDNPIDIQITVEEVDRLLEVGRLLFSVLTSEEIEELQQLFSPKNPIGNAGDS